MSSPDEVTPVAVADIVVEEVDESPKVFIGNLPFVATKEQIAEFFAECGQVTNVIIITRYGRSLGFGFVSFSTIEEMQSASLMDKKELLGRPVNIELARPKIPNADRPPREPRKAREPRPKKADDVEAARVDDDGNVIPPKAPKVKKVRAPRPPPSGELSETMLFVSNLPFAVKDDDLRAIFQEFKVKTARIVTLRNGRSKGFGFVDVENHEEQLRVLNEFSSIAVDGRELLVKQANAPLPEADGVEAAGDDADLVVVEAPES